MAPEQVEGRTVDRRADIWAFGCILFEMLAGSRAFAGDSIGSLFAAIATEAPDLQRVAHAPPRVRRLIARCLRKDPKARLRDIGDARVDLEEIVAGKDEYETAGTPPTRPGRAVPALLVIVAVLLGGLIAALVPSETSTPPSLAPSSVQRFSIALPGDPLQLRLDTPSG